jgi:TrmH family RNA methyltransferase
VRAVRDLHQRKARKARRETIIEGPTVFGAFIDARVVPSLVLCTPNDGLTIERCAAIGVEPVLVTADVLRSASDTRSPRSPVAAVPTPDPDQLRRHNTLVLVDIQDPGNVGTMIRSAAALGWDVAVSGSTAELWAPKTIRSAVGAHTSTSLTQLADPLEEANATGLKTVSMVVAGAGPPGPIDEPVALMVGSESHGLPDDIIQRSDHRTTIAMPGGIESFNASVAASIAMYAMTALDG